MSMGGGIQQGCITLVLHRAESLVGLNPGGTSNPFVTAAVSNQSHATPVVNGTTNPVFDTTFTFTACPLPTILTLRVYNRVHDTGAEELLGSATITLFSASPMTRRTVHLSHGGNVLLSQKARDGCGSLDISYEVVVAGPQEVGQSQQRSTGNYDLPAFLQEDNGPMNFTSAYSALAQPPLASVPPPPQPPVASVPPPPQPPLASVPPPPQPPLASVPPPPQPPVQPTTTTVQLSQFAPVQKTMFVPEPPLAPSVVPHHSIQASSGILGPVATSPLMLNVNERSMPMNTVTVDSLSPAPVQLLQPPQQQQLLPSSLISLTHTSESSKMPPFPSDLHSSAANVPVASAGPLPFAVEQLICSVPLANGGGSAQQVKNVSGPTAEGVDMLHGVVAAPPPPPLTSFQPAFSTRVAETSPSAESTVTTTSSLTPSSTRTGNQSSKQWQEQPMGHTLPVPPHPTSGLPTSLGTASLLQPQQPQQQKQPVSDAIRSPPAAAAAAATTTTTATATAAAAAAAATAAGGKTGEKPKKKVTILAAAKDTSAGSSIGPVALKTMTPLERPPRRAVASPTRDVRRSSSSGNAGRSSSRGRTNATAGLHRPISQGVSMYQRPDELLAAAAEGNVAVFQKLREEDPLLSRGFDSVRDYSGRTILHIAAWHGHTTVLKTLLQPSPSVPMLELRALRSNNGNTILHSAAYGGCIDLVQWLRFGHAAMGTLLGMRNVRGVTATDCAREAGFAEIAALLDETSL